MVPLLVCQVVRLNSIHIQVLRKYWEKCWEVEIAKTIPKMVVAVLHEIWALNSLAKLILEG